MDNKYGYKVCYKEFDKNKMKIHLVCNTFSGAEWSVQYYETHPQRNRKTNNLIREPTWFIEPIKSFIEYKWLWKGCPF